MKLFAENTGAVAFFLGSSQASMFTANMYKKSTYPESTTAYALAELGVSMRVLFPLSHSRFLSSHQLAMLRCSQNSQRCLHQHVLLLI